MGASTLKLLATVAVAACALSAAGCKKTPPTPVQPDSGNSAAPAPGGMTPVPKPTPAMSTAPGDSTFCDCTNVSAGLLTKEYQKQCGERDAQLRLLTVDCGGSVGCYSQRLKLTQGPDGKLKSGEFCDSVAYGPAAWPLQGGPVNPPPRPIQKKPCDKVSGLSRTCE
jgi:hypothetical protein